MSTFEITPSNGRKSFYGKCKVKETNKFLTLLSYETKVASYNKETKKLTITKNKSYLTKTTLTHINGFLSYLNLDSMTKKQILSL